MARGTEKKRVAATSVLAAVFLTGTKLTVGLMTGSLGILSEAAHSGLDLVAAAMTWWAVSFSDRPADSDHPYGHEKLENMSALFETLLLLVTCFWIIYEAVERLFFKTSVVEVNAWSYGVIILAIAIDFSRSRALMRVAKKTRSAALEADAVHFSSDIYSSLVVLGGLVTTQLGYPKADAIAALGVSVFVMWICYNLGMKAVQALTDKVSSGHLERAEKAALSIPGVKRAYAVRVREAGAKHFVDLKVAVDRTASLAVAHEVTEAVERALEGAFKQADVLVHAEPDEAQPIGLSEQITLLGERAGAKPHAIEIYSTGDGLVVGMHLEWPDGMTLDEAHRGATAIEEELRSQYPDVRFVQTHLESAGDAIPPSKDLTAENEKLVAAIRKKVASHPGVSGCGEIRLMEKAGRCSVSLTCFLPPGVVMKEAHAAATLVEDEVLALSRRIGSVVVHTEPRG